MSPPWNRCRWDGCSQQRERGKDYCSQHWQQWLINTNRYLERELRAQGVSDEPTPERAAGERRADVTRMRRRIDELERAAGERRAEVARMRWRIEELEQHEQALRDALADCVLSAGVGEAVDWDAVAALTDAQLRGFVKIARRVRGQQANPAAYALRWVRENMGGGRDG